ncbi:hypothetical protein [Pseudomonas sp. GL-R-26]|uniref:hypothetical protein n=1 Tax=Pseudomonas sp. GL-R-26 TaxID=2832392 RepID=UPI001CBCCD90|nr:hypothetical protein [Pseudomonas sp. GL-R-26]
MACTICGNEEAAEDKSFGGGLRFHCLPCGGFFRISSTLDTLAEGKIFNIDRSRERLEELRELKKREPQDPNRPQDLEPTLTSDDQELLNVPN